MTNREEERVRAEESGVSPFLITTSRITRESIDHVKTEERARVTAIIWSLNQKASCYVMRDEQTVAQYVYGLEDRQTEVKSAGDLQHVNLDITRHMAVQGSAINNSYFCLRLRQSIDQELREWIENEWREVVNKHNEKHVLGIPLNSLAIDDRFVFNTLPYPSESIFFLAPHLLSALLEELEP